MNQNTPNPGLALRWPHPCSLPIEWGGGGCPPNVNLRPRVVLDTQVWLPARDRDGKCCLLARDVMINSRGERMTKALEGTEVSQQTPSNIRRRNQRVQTTVTTNHHMRLVEFSHVALEDPWLRGWPLINLILFIITFDLNCSKSFFKKKFIFSTIKINHWINNSGIIFEKKIYTVKPFVQSLPLSSPLMKLEKSRSSTKFDVNLNKFFIWIMTKI